MLSHMVDCAGKGLGGVSDSLAAEIEGRRDRALWVIIACLFSSGSRSFEGLAPVCPRCSAVAYI